MDSYNKLQDLVSHLNTDFNKDEVQLIDELKQLEKDNVKSLRHFKEVKGNALKMKE